VTDNLLLAIPNVSDGRDTGLVRTIAGTDALLDVHSDPDHNRSVLTYGGTPGEIVDALAAMIDRAVTSLDIRKHDGVHPRFGVVDVVPFVTYRATEEVARNAMAELAWRVAQGPGVPVHFYGHGYASLPQVRRALRDHDETAHPSGGVICMGIRDPLVAFNVNLDTTLGNAKLIAMEIRSPGIRALGFTLASRNLVQVSMNLVRPHEVGPRAAFQAVAERTNNVVDAEIVGLVPDEVDVSDLPLRAPARTVAQAFAEVRPG
jgi:glutamate formiminotransferase